MARKAKTGLDYFPLDSDFYSDIRLRRLTRTFGSDALGVYIILTGMIYRRGYFLRYDDDVCFCVAETLGCDEELVGRIVGASAAAGLFDKMMLSENGVLTSVDIQETYTEICRQCRRKSRISDFSLISDAAEESTTDVKHDAGANNATESSINAADIAVKSAVMPQKKEKEIKEKEIKPNRTFSHGKEPREHEDFWNEFFSAPAEVLERVYGNLALEPDEFHALACEVRCEWDIARRTHPGGYSDFASHLIAAVRRKAADRSTADRIAAHRREKSHQAARSRRRAAQEQEKTQGGAEPANTPVAAKAWAEKMVAEGLSPTMTPLEYYKAKGEGGKGER